MIFVPKMNSHELNPYRSWPGNSERDGSGEFKQGERSGNVLGIGTIHYYEPNFIYLLEQGS